MEDIALGLASILVLGIVAQWVGWRFRIPSIILLLLFGFVAGPVTGLLDPDALFGDLLLPIVSISVGVILFEGGLSLRLSELREVGREIRGLITVGALVTWLLAALAAWIFLDLSWPIALLFGAILVVTGPTVVGPLLRHVGNTGPSGKVLKWEGILIDPIGATLALLVYQAILPHPGGGGPAETVLLGLLRSAFFGGGIGLVAAWLLVQPLKRNWIPDFLQNPVTLMTVVAAFTLADHFQAESGLLATTVMGIVLINQNAVDARHIVEFKENLVVLLISSLFILLSARLDLTIVDEINAGGIVFMAVLLLVIRPLSVALATFGSSLERRQRIFVAWMAPRGIVAAAVASIFALELAETGFPEAERLVPLAFLTVVLTATIYGFTAVPLARWLRLAEGSPLGILIAGAHDWARQIAAVLQAQGHEVLLVDSNRANIRRASLDGLRAIHGNVLSEVTEERIALEGLGRLLALTPNDEVNTLAAINFADLFGKEEVYQVAPRPAGRRGDEVAIPRPLTGHILFGDEITIPYLSDRFREGAEVKATPITEKFTYDEFRSHYGERALPLFLIDRLGKLQVATEQSPLVPGPGTTLISLVDPEPEVLPEPEGQSG